MEPNITPWRRTVCGDLISAFDFGADNRDWSATLPDTGHYNARADAAHLLPAVKRPSGNKLPAQEAGRRPARPLPYALEVTGAAEAGQFTLKIENRGAAVALAVYADGGAAGPWFYTVDAGAHLTDQLPIGKQGYAFTVHGPNGFLRRFTAKATTPAVAIEPRYDAGTESLVLRLANNGNAPVTIFIRPRTYIKAPTRRHRLAPGAAVEDLWPIAASDHWYDLEARSAGAVWRFAGHCETGRPSWSDPVLGGA
jgi:phospholipase C